MGLLSDINLDDDGGASHITDFYKSTSVFDWHKSALTSEYDLSTTLCLK